MMLDKRYFERKFMKSKEVEDVLGGADSWQNVDKTESQWTASGRIARAHLKRNLFTDYWFSQLQGREVR